MANTRRKARTGWHGESGQSLLETALMISVIFVVVFWIFETGQLMYTYTVIADAANEGVRHAIVHSGGDLTGTITAVTNTAKISMHDVSAISISVTFPDGSATPPNRVLVTVSYPYVPTLGSFAPTMTAYSEGRMVVN